MPSRPNESIKGRSQRISRRVARGRTVYVWVHWTLLQRRPINTIDHHDDVAIGQQLLLELAYRRPKSRRHQLLLNVLGSTVVLIYSSDLPIINSE